MSRLKWPWLLLCLLILAVGIGGGWLLKGFTTSGRSSSSAMTGGVPATATIAVTISDETVQIGSDQSGHIETGHKGSVQIPDAELEKLALMLRPASPSLISTLVPPVSALLVSLIALGGVILAADKAAKTARDATATERDNHARSEWFGRFKEMLDLALSSDGNRIKLGIRLLEQHVTSSLAGIEEKQLALDVLAQIMDSALKQVGVSDPSASATPGQTDAPFVVDKPQ